MMMLMLMLLHTIKHVMMALVDVTIMKMLLMVKLMLLQAIKHDYFSYFPDRYLLSITMVFGELFTIFPYATCLLHVRHPQTPE